MPEQLTEAQERARATWQYRIIETTRGNQSQLGCVVLAVLGKSASNPPKITGSATIKTDGQVYANFTGSDCVARQGVHICSVEDLQRNFSGLADHLKLSDEERVEMFGEVKKWIWKDERANTTLRFTQGG